MTHVLPEMRLPLAAPWRPIELHPRHRDEAAARVADDLACHLPGFGRHRDEVARFLRDQALAALARGAQDAYGFAHPGPAGRPLLAGLAVGLLGLDPRLPARDRLSALAVELGTAEPANQPPTSARVCVLGRRTVLDALQVTTDPRDGSRRWVATYVVPLPGRTDALAVWLRFTVPDGSTAAELLAMCHRTVEGMVV